MATEEQVAAASLTRIQTALGDRVTAYEPDKVPTPRPSEYVVVTVVRRAGGPGRSGRYSTSGWAVYVMAASDASVANARLSLQKIRDEIEDKTLALDTDPVETSTPMNFRTARPVAPDDGWFSGTDTFNFAI